MKKLLGKIAVITGGAQGIGKAIALRFASEGAKVVIGDLNLAHAKELVDSVSNMNYNFIAHKVDISDQNEVIEFFAQVFRELNQIDILVNNAGIGGRKTFLETTDEEWNRIIDVNLKGTIRCCRAVFKHMVERRSGKIINIASIAGKRGGGLIGKSYYAASKAGIIALTKGLAREGGPYGINSNAVAPGLTETPLTKDVPEDMSTYLRNNVIPLRRLGKPEDVANAVTFLASSEADYINGEIMDVDGGVTLD